MAKIRKLTREEKKDNFEILGLHFAHYRKMMLIISSIVLVAAITFAIYWCFDPVTISPLIDALYLVSHLFFLAVSVFIIVLLVLNKYEKVTARHLAISLHVYSFLLIAWSTVLCIMDLQIGSDPEIFLLAATFVAGILTIDPLFFSITTLTSFTTIMIFQAVRQYPYFTNEFIYENIIHFVTFFVLLVLISFRSHHVTIEEYHAKAQLEFLTYHDELTGLYNERCYLEEIDKIADEIKEGEVEPFAVVMMDVNNLKATNDAYGHRYGCHLVVRCGQMLPKLFKNSKLFHVGGDEFIAIVRGNDLDNLEELIKEFDEKYIYSTVKFSGKELIFSIARGYSIYKKGDRYIKVLQRADEAMYENKKHIKEKYDMAVR